MVTTGTWATWLRDQLAERDWTQAELVRRSESRVSSPQLSRWLRSEQVPSWGSVRDVCGALGVPAVQGMIAAGLLTPSDVGVTVVNRPRDLRELPHRELLDEIARRLDQGISAGVVGVPSLVDESDAVPPPRTVPFDQATEGDQQAARRRRT